MDAFSYLSVLLSIILGLAITQILKGMRGLALSRAHVVIYWPTLVWCALLLVINVQGWWAMFGLREIRSWTFAMFSIVLLQTIVTYLLSGLVLPDFYGERSIDLRVHYFAHRRLFFGLFIAALLISLAKDLVLSGHITDRVNLAFHLCFIALSAGGCISAKDWYHKLLCMLSAVGFGLYIALLFAQLR